MFAQRNASRLWPTPRPGALPRGSWNYPIPLECSDPDEVRLAARWSRGVTHLAFKANRCWWPQEPVHPSPPRVWSHSDIWALMKAAIDERKGGISWSHHKETATFSTPDTGYKVYKVFSINWLQYWEKNDYTEWLLFFLLFFCWGDGPSWNFTHCYNYCCSEKEKTES